VRAAIVRVGWFSYAAHDLVIVMLDEMLLPEAAAIIATVLDHDDPTTDCPPQTIDAGVAADVAARARRGPARSHTGDD
jgi:hypothetical protein